MLADVTTRGSFPDTELVMRYVDREDGLLYEASWTIWDDEELIGELRPTLHMLAGVISAHWEVGEIDPRLVRDAPDKP